MNTQLTNIFKQLIQSNGLVKSGRLINSIKVYVTITNNILSINITGTDYLYTKAIEYKLTDQFTNNLLFSEEISLLFETYLNKEVELYLNNPTSSVNLDFKIIILYNNI
jgi:hypothetical protein